MGQRDILNYLKRHKDRQDITLVELSCALNVNVSTLCRQIRSLCKGRFICVTVDRKKKYVGYYDGGEDMEKDYEPIKFEFFQSDMEHILLFLREIMEEKEVRESLRDTASRIYRDIDHKVSIHMREGDWK